MTLYRGDFEYHFGSLSPNLSSDLALNPSAPRPDSRDAAFRPARLVGVQDGRKGATELWLRTRLAGPPLLRPTLSLRIAASQIAFFLDGNPISAQAFESAPYEAVTRVRGEYMLSLPSDYAGRMLTLRLRTRAPAMGLEAMPRLGEATAVALDLMRRRADIFVCVVLLCLSSLCCIALLIVQRSERLYLYYAIGCTSYAISFVGFSGIGGLLFRWPLPHYPTHILFNATGHMAMLSFVMNMLDAGPGQVLVRVRWIFGAYIAVYLAAMLLQPTLIPLLMLPNRLLTVALAAGLLAVAVRGWRRGNAEARILAWSIFAMIAFSIPEYLLIAGLIQMELGAMYVPTIMLFLGALAVLLVRRFFASQAQALQLQIEHRLAEQRLGAQEALLQASARMAAGDLEQPILAADGSPLLPLAHALDGMRQEMRSKIQLLARMQDALRGQVDALEVRNREIGQLNVELRRQIEQRSRRLFDMLLPAAGGPPSSRLLEPGELLAEHYRVVHLLGQGGMGTVYEVERLTDQKRLAAKVLRRGVFDRLATSRFAREAQIMARLHHPNLVAISDVDVTTNGTLYLVMELVSGHSLAQLRPRFGDVAWGRAILAQVADALAALHAHDIVHRDIKPENVLVATIAGQPQVKLADFGIARLGGDAAALASGPGDPLAAAEAADVAAQPAVAEIAAGAAHEHTDPVGAETLGCSDFPAPEPDRRSPHRTPQAGQGTLTQTGVVMGTPGYLAPELLHGAKQARPTVDIYSLGVMAVEVLTGRRPSSGRSALLRDSDPSVSKPLMEVRPGLPRPLITIIERAMALDPQARPSAAELATALRTLGDTEA